MCTARSPQGRLSYSVLRHRYNGKYMVEKWERRRNMVHAVESGGIEKAKRVRKRLMPW